MCTCVTDSDVGNKPLSAAVPDDSDAVKTLSSTLNTGSTSVTAAQPFSCAGNWNVAGGFQFGAQPARSMLASANASVCSPAAATSTPKAISISSAGQMTAAPLAASKLFAVETKGCDVNTAVTCTSVVSSSDHATSAFSVASTDSGGSVKFSSFITSSSSLPSPCTSTVLSPVPNTIISSTVPSSSVVSATSSPTLTRHASAKDTSAVSMPSITSMQSSSLFSFGQPPPSSDSSRFGHSGPLGVAVTSASLQFTAAPAGQ